MKNRHLLRVVDLKKHFPLRGGWLSSLSSGEKKVVRAVDGVSFDLEQSEILGFVGESGCGKSTMSRTILRLTEPTSGQVFYNEVDLATLSKRHLKRYRQKMQMIFQDPFSSLNPRRTVADTLRQTIHIHDLAVDKDDERALIRNALEEVELRPVGMFRDKYPALLSGGQLQRVSIARVMILQPSFVIADESVSMLDVSVRIGILELIRRMRDQHQVSFIYITHDLVTARYICDRIAIMYLGRIVEIGPTEEIIHNPCHPYTKALIAAVPDPDPQAEVSELPIKGYVTTNTETDMTGCSFYNRCPEAVEECREGYPDMAAMGPDHQASCFRAAGNF